MPIFIFWILLNQVLRSGFSMLQFDERYFNGKRPVALFDIFPDGSERICRTNLIVSPGSGWNRKAKTGG